MSSPSIPGKMEAKPLFNVQKALVQPVQMCMLDIPLSVQDDDVSRRRGAAARGGSGARRGALRCPDPTPAPSGGGELVAKLRMPRAGTASRCDRFLSEALYPEAGCGAAKSRAPKRKEGFGREGKPFCVE